MTKKKPAAFELLRMCASIRRQRHRRTAGHRQWDPKRRGTDGADGRSFEQVSSKSSLRLFHRRVSTGGSVSSFLRTFDDRTQNRTFAFKSLSARWLRSERRWQLYPQNLGSVLLLLSNFGWIPGTVSNRKRLHLI